MTEERYQADLRAMVRAAYGPDTTLHDVLVRCEGADPRLVASIIAEVQPESPAPSSPGRLQTTAFAGGAPAPNPLASQWWFTVETVERLAKLAKDESSDRRSAKLLAVGAPTVALQYSRLYGEATAVDIDRDLKTVWSAAKALTIVIGDIYEPSPSLPVSEYDVAIVDPPWYPEDLEAFLSFAIRSVRVGGNIFCSLPPRMTRPTVVSERQTLLSTMMAAGVEFVSLSPQATEYYVPPFELAAYGDLPGFDGRPWRRGDLLHLRKTGACVLATPPRLPKPEARAYSIVPVRYRVFARVSRDASSSSSLELSTESLFSRTVSSRQGRSRRLP